MKIGLDMMGGDFAPLEAAKGIKKYVKHNANPAHLVLIGNEEQVNICLNELQIDPSSYTLIHASQVIDMHEHPTTFISAGNTGAMMVGSLFSIKPIEGVLRPSIGAYMPRENGHNGWLMDVGLNADCKPENLVQFAILGSLFVQHVWNVDSPKVALVNIGEEEGKGNLLTQAAYPLLKDCDKINFIGNVEGRDIFLDKADVMVCEGFTGNVILKLAESFYDLTKRRNVEDPFFDKFNFEQYGGVPVLGINKPVIIGHGISGEEAFCNMIQMAEKMIRTDLLEKIKSNFVTSM